jgi:hypothetical protein
MPAELEGNREPHPAHRHRRGRPNELVTTRYNDAAHTCVFSTALRSPVGPNAQLSSTRSSSTPTTKTGELAITATKGVFRLVGGKISKNQPDHRHHAVEHDRHPRRHHDLRTSPRPRTVFELRFVGNPA